MTTWLDTLEARQQAIITAGIEDVAHVAEAALDPQIGAAAPLANTIIEDAAKAAETHEPQLLHEALQIAEDHEPGFIRRLLEHFGLQHEPAAAGTPAAGPAPDPNAPPAAVTFASATGAQ